MTSWIVPNRFLTARSLLNKTGYLELLKPILPQPKQSFERKHVGWRFNANTFRTEQKVKEVVSLLLGELLVFTSTRRAAPAAATLLWHRLGFRQALSFGGAFEWGLIKTLGAGTCLETSFLEARWCTCGLWLIWVRQGLNYHWLCWSFFSGSDRFSKQLKKKKIASVSSLPSPLHSMLFVLQ